MRPRSRRSGPTQSVWLVDLDLYAVGDPAIDIGNVLAHLDELGLRRSGDAGAFAAQAAAFLAGYGAVRVPPAAGRVATLRAVSLARHVALSRRLPGRGHTMAALLARARVALVEEVGTPP